MFKSQFRWFFQATCLLLFFSTLPVHAATLEKLAAIDLTGPAGKRFDYLTIDTKHQYLLSTHLGAGLLYIIDLKTNTLVDTISDVPGAEGVVYLPSADKIYTSDWYEKRVAVIDLKSRSITKKITVEAKPDGMAYAEPFNKLYVSDERAKAVIVIDTVRDEIVRTLRFDSETGMPQYDPVSKLIYVNLQDQNLFAVIDPATDTIAGKHLVGNCKGNHGMTLDVSHRRAFLGCEENNLLAVFDLTTFSPIEYIPVPDGVDVIMFDAGLSRVYAACYSGFISVIHEDDPNHFRKLEDFPTAKKVHSLAVDPNTHRVYAPEQEENGKPVSRMVIYKARQEHLLEKGTKL